MQTTHQEQKNAHFKRLQASDMIRLRCTVTGKWLHLDGRSLTSNHAHAWLGTRAQGRTLRDRALTRNEDWTLRAFHRDDADRDREKPRIELTPEEML